MMVIVVFDFRVVVFVVLLFIMMVGWVLCVLEFIVGLKVVRMICLC